MKAKTHRSTAKRLRVTRNGKVVAAKAFKSHLLGHKSRKRKRQLKKKSVLTLAATRGVHRLLPYA